MAKEMLVALLSGYPPEEIIYRTQDASYTGSDMMKEIEEGTEVGRKYAAGMMRVTRRMLAEQAQGQPESEELPQGPNP
jgi:hypothetical protein